MESYLKSFQIRARLHLPVILIGLSLLLLPVTSFAAQPAVIGMGDSIGEGVQAADAAWQTQVYSYQQWVGFQMGSPLTLPYIKSGILGFVGDTSNRSRIYPSEIGTNVAVSGATVNSLLYDRPAAQTQEGISTETELVLFPRQQTQMEYVESSPPGMILCWIGNNDVLSAAISFGNLNASQLTPVEDFQRDYKALVDRFEKMVQSNGTKIVFANIPNVTDIGFLVDRNTAEKLTGFTVNLPDGHYTSVLGVLLMKFLGNDGLMDDPNFVLDDAEILVIEERVQIFNEIIQNEADRIGMPVVDINAKFSELIENPPVFAGITLSKTILKGLFSLDGVHPSNIGHGLVANEFIKTINTAFGMNVPQLDQNVLTWLFLLDPAIDKDNDGRATGRLGVGLIETLSFLFGITGDPNDFTPN